MRSGSGYDLVPTPPEDGYITHMETDVVDDVTGEPVPISRLMLHHIVFTNLNHQDTTCAGKGYVGFGGRKDFGNTFAPQRFYAAGEERAKMSLPPGYGYRDQGLRRLGHRRDGDEPPLEQPITPSSITR